MKKQLQLHYLWLSYKSNVFIQGLSTFWYLRPVSGCQQICEDHLPVIVWCFLVLFPLLFWVSGLFSRAHKHQSRTEKGSCKRVFVLHEHGDCDYRALDPPPRSRLRKDARSVAVWARRKIKTLEAGVQWIPFPPFDWSLNFLLALL